MNRGRKKGILVLLYIYLFSIPGVVSRFVEGTINNGCHQENADQYGSDETPCDLPIRAWHVTRHLENVLREPARNRVRSENKREPCHQNKRFFNKNEIKMRLRETESALENSATLHHPKRY